MDINKVILVGRLGGDPVLRQTKNGIAVASFSMATSRRLKSEPGAEPVEETQWHRVVAWGKQGQRCSEFLRKGSSVLVEGAVRTRKFSDSQGVARLAFEVHADQVSFLSRTGSRVKLDEIAEASTSTEH